MKVRKWQVYTVKITYENVMWEKLKGHTYTNKIYLWDIILPKTVLLAGFNKDICNFKADLIRQKKPRCLWKWK